jgi:hypothetical protein
MLWALGQPVAALGLAAAFVLGAALRAAVHRQSARRWGGIPPLPAASAVGALGAITLVFTGTGWWRPSCARRPLCVAAGPVAVLVAGEACLGAFAAAFPAQRASLRLNYPSDVLRGVVGVPPGAQVLLSLGVGLLCFGLLALLPVPPLDGYRLGTAAFLQPARPTTTIAPMAPVARRGPMASAGPVTSAARVVSAAPVAPAAPAVAGAPATGEWPAVLGALALLLLAVVPLGDRSPLLAALDLIATPLIRLWA